MPGMAICATGSKPSSRAVWKSLPSTRPWASSIAFTPLGSAPLMPIVVPFRSSIVGALPSLTMSVSMPVLPSTASTRNSASFLAP